MLSLLAVPVAQLLPAIATEFGSEAHYLGFLTAFYSLGASLVAWALHRIRHDYPKLRLVDQTTVACGMSLIAVALIGGILGDPGRRAAVIVLLIPIGLGVSIVQAVLTATVQLSASAEMEGEVIALYGMTVSIVAPVGAITLGAVADATQVWLSVGIGGVLLALAGLHRLLRARPPTPARRGTGAPGHHPPRPPPEPLPGRADPLRPVRADRAAGFAERQAAAGVRD